MGTCSIPLDNTSIYSGRTVPIAVVGAHLRGFPLNHQLTSLSAKFRKQCRTSSSYRLFDISTPEDSAKGLPPRPGLVRVASEGAAIEVEVWEVPAEEVGAFLQQVKPPLAIGDVTLDDGTSVKGFITESVATQNAKDISSFGGWRNYLGKR